jgi:hypothetical protein
MLFVLPTVPATLEDRKRLRPIGRKRALPANAGRVEKARSLRR